MTHWTLYHVEPVIEYSKALILGSLALLATLFFIFYSVLTYKGWKYVQKYYPEGTFAKKSNLKKVTLIVMGKMLE